MYVYGTQFWCVVIADSFVSLTMAVVYLPVFYGLGITSSYEVRAILRFLRLDYSSNLLSLFPFRLSFSLLVSIEQLFSVSKVEIQRCCSTDGFRHIFNKNGKRLLEAKRRNVEGSLADRVLFAVTLHSAGDIRSRVSI